MLAKQYGKLIKEARIQRGWKQDELASKAQVARAVLSRLEQSNPKAIQSDTLDRLLAALELSPQIGGSNDAGPRKMARLEQEIKIRKQRERHLRLAISLGDNASGAADKVAKARQRVELWRKNSSCSPLYIDQWTRLLALQPREMAKAMSSLGEWEDAMFQNSPWSWAWT